MSPTTTYRSAFALSEPFLYEDPDLQMTVGLSARGSYSAMLRNPANDRGDGTVPYLTGLVLSALQDTLAAFSGKTPASSLDAGSLSSALSARVLMLFSNEGFMGSATLEEIGVADAYRPAYEAAKAALDAKRAAAEIAFDFSLPEGIIINDAASGSNVRITGGGSCKVTMIDPAAFAGQESMERARAAAIEGAKKFIADHSGRYAAADLPGKELETARKMSVMTSLYQAGFLPVSSSLDLEAAPVRAASPAPAAPPAGQRPAVMIFCPNCGRKNTNLGKFCEDCGTSLTGTR